MNSLPGWHPIVVHFPMALVTSGAALLLLAKVIRRDEYAATLATVGTWNLCLGALAAVIAMATGLAAVLDLDVGSAAHRAISLHLRWAIFTSLALLLLAVWRGAGGAQASRPSWVFVALLIGAGAALMLTGIHGHENVYRHGIGVSPASATASAPGR